MKVLISTLFILFAITAFGQKGVEKIEIQTSAECNSCKKRIEEKLNYTKGVRFAELDVPSKVLTVSFSSKKITANDIKKIISDIGYDADDLKANKTAYEALPECCKVGGM
jgi:copper chaperone CopZ